MTLNDKRQDDYHPASIFVPNLIGCCVPYGDALCTEKD